MDPLFQGFLGYGYSLFVHVTLESGFLLKIILLYLLGSH